MENHKHPWDSITQKKIILQKHWIFSPDETTALQFLQEIQKNGSVVSIFKHCFFFLIQKTLEFV